MSELHTKLTESFNNPEFTEEQLDFLLKKFPACMGHLILVINHNKTDKGYKWKDFYEDDSPLKEGNYRNVANEQIIDVTLNKEDAYYLAEFLDDPSPNHAEYHRFLLSRISETINNELEWSRRELEKQKEEN